MEYIPNTQGLSPILKKNLDDIARVLRQKSGDRAVALATPATVVGSPTSGDHEWLYGRNNPNQHIIASTTGLTEALAGKRVLHGCRMTSDANGNSVWPDITRTYDSETRTCTIHGTAYVEGVLYSYSSVALSHEDILGPYFFYIDASGVFSVSSSYFDMFTQVHILAVWHDPADPANCDWLEERHGADRDRAWHYTQHFAKDGGTRLDSVHSPVVTGVTQGGENPVGPTDAGNRPAISSHDIFDEDIRKRIGAIADNGPYTVLYYNDTKPIHSTGLPDIFTVGVTYAQYGNAAGGLVESTNNRYIVMFGYSKPSLRGAGYDCVFIPGQQEFTSFADAVAYSPGSMNLTWMPSPEYVPHTKFIYKCSAGYSTRGKAGLCVVLPITSSRNQTSSVMTGVGGVGTTHRIPRWTGTGSIGDSRMTDDGTTLTLPEATVTGAVRIFDAPTNVNLSIGMSSQADGIDPGIAAGPRTGEGVDAYIIRDAEGHWTAYDHFRAFDTLGCGGVATLNSVVSERTIAGGQQVSPITTGTHYVDPREFTVLNIGTLTGNFGLELVGAVCPPGTVQHISFRQGSTVRSVTFTSVLSTTFRQNGVNASGTSRVVSGVDIADAYYTLTLKWIDANIIMITVG